MADSAAYWLLAALRQLKRPAEAEIVADAHLQVCERRAAADPAAADAQVCLRWEERAGARISQGHWDEAIALAERAVSARQRQLAALAPAGGAAAATAARTAVAEAQFLLGRALRGAGQYAAAERPLREALLNRFQMLGADHAKVAEAAVALMSNYCFLGRFAEARPLAEQALAIEAKLYPRADDPRRADTYHRAADRAETLYRQALASLLARPRQPEDRFLTHACDALGRFLYGQGRRPEAILVYRRELEIERRLGCADDREREGLSTVCNNLGRALLEENRLAEADAALSEALRVTESTPGGRAHPDATAVLSNLALLRAEQGRYAESETLFQEAFDGRVRAFGFAHPKVAYTLQGMARLYELTGRAVQAQEADARARTILASVR